MAKDTREIVVKITQTKGSQQQTHQEKVRETEKQKTEQQQVSLGTVVGTMVVNKAVQVTREAVNFAMGNINSLSGDARVVRQVEELEVAYGIVEDAISIGTSAMAGAAAGSAVPVVGTAIGAVVGAGLAVVSVGVKRTEQALQFRQQLATENRSVLFLKARAGEETNNWSR